MRCSESCCSLFSRRLSSGRWCAFALCLVAVAVGSGLRASVYDDAVFRLQGDCDANCDGVVTTGEAKDAARYSSPNAVSMNVSGTVDGETKSQIACIEKDVVLPRLGKTVRAKVLHLNTKTAKLSGGEDSVWTSALMLPGDFPQGCSMSMLIRFCWDGPVLGTAGVTGSSMATLVNYGYSYGDDDGFVLYVKPSGTEGVGHLQFESKSVWMSPGNSMPIEPGKWYDLAFTIAQDAGSGGQDLVCVYYWPAGNSNYKRTKTWSNSGTFFQDARVKSYCSIGSWNYQGADMFAPKETWGDKNIYNYAKNFNGDIHEVAFWNRALSATEVEEAFLGSAADFQFGVANGVSDEFAGSSEGTCDQYAGWHRMCGSLSAKGEGVSIQFNPGEDRMAVSRVLHVRTCPGTYAAASLGLWVNGTLVEKIDASPNHDLLYYIKADLFAAENTLTLKQESDAGSVHIDWLELGGGFKTINDRNQELYNDVQLKDCDAHNMPHVLSAGAASRTHTFRFVLSDALAALPYVWTFTHNGWPGTAARGITMAVNGTTVYETHDKLPKTQAVKIAAGLFGAGENVVTISNEMPVGTSDAYYDFTTHVLEPVVKRGFIVIFR